MKRRMLALCLLLVLVAPIMLLIQTNSILPSVKAQTTPSIPEFTVRYVDNSHYTQPTTTTTTDPYTGKQTVITTPSSYVQDEYIELAIKNQSFTPSTVQDNGDSYTTGLYFDIRTKGHFSDDWYDISTNPYLEENYSSQYTIFYAYYNNLPSGGQIDFQVRGIIGYVHGVEPIIAQVTYILTGQNGDWTNVQTINIPEPQTEPFPTALVAVVSVVSVVLVGIGLLVYFKKRKHQSE